MVEIIRRGFVRGNGSEEKEEFLGAMVEKKRKRFFRGYGRKEKEEIF